jgi:phospholipase/carboxylesterase
MRAELAFIHRFEPGAGSRPLLLLHGTGGDEDDLIPLGRMVAPDAPLLSPRGKVLENGAPRFFRRLAEGVFDEADVRARAEELADFIAAARAAYDLAPPVGLGYSNGANIAAAVMLLRPEALAGAILLRAMAPLANPGTAGGLAGKSALIVSGADDPIAPPANAARLKAMLEQAGARVDHRVIAAGHQLSQADVRLAREWLDAEASAEKDERGQALIRP